MSTIDIIEKTESTIITTHDTSYFYKPGLKNVFDSAKAYHITCHPKKEIVIKRASLDQIFNMSDIPSIPRDQFIGIIIISYSEGSEEEEGTLVSAIQNKVNILANSHKKQKDEHNEYQHTITHEKSNKMPRIRIDYLNCFLDSLDVLIMFKCLPNSIVELYKVRLANGEYALIRKEEFMRLMTCERGEGQGRSVTVCDWSGNSIEVIGDDEEVDLDNDESRYWMMMLDCEGNEAIVNVKQFQKMFTKNRQEFILIEDYDENKRKIYKDFDRNKSNIMNSNRTNKLIQGNENDKGKGNDKPLLKSKNKVTLLKKEIEPESNPEEMINAENDQLHNMKSNEDIDIFENNTEMKPQLRSKKVKADLNNIKDETHLKKTMIPIPLEMLYSYIYQISIEKELPLTANHIDDKGQITTISPKEATSDYLCQYYIEDGDYSAPKYHQVKNNNTNTEHMIPEEEYAKVPNLGSSTKPINVKDFNGKEIQVQDNNENDIKWMKAFDAKKSDMYIQSTNFLQLLTKPKEIEKITEIKDNNNNNRQFDIMHYLSKVFFVNHPELLKEFQDRQRKRELEETDANTNANSNTDTNKEIKITLKSKTKPKHLIANTKGNNDYDKEANRKDADCLKTIYTDIKDLNNKQHIIEANTILSSSYSNYNNSNLVSDTEEDFVPNQSEIESYNENNDVHKLYRLLDANNEQRYIPQPYIIMIFEQLFQSHEKIPNTVLIQDYQLTPHEIPFDSILPFLRMTPYYKQITQIKHIHKTERDQPLQSLSQLTEGVEGDYSPSLIQSLKTQTLDEEDLTYVNEVIEIPNYAMNTKYKPQYKYNIKRDYQHVPYSFIDNDTNSYYKIPNFSTKQIEFKSKPELISLLNNPKSTSENNNYNNYIVSCILDDNNYNHEYIEIEDLEHNKVYIRKVYLMKYINKLINNEPISIYCPIEDKDNKLIQIDLHTTLMNYIIETPSPYEKDGVLINVKNTLYESFSKDQAEEGVQFIQCDKETYKIPKVDLFEYMSIKDIQSNSFIVRKPFVRSLLYKPNPLINFPIRDSANQIRLVSPIQVLGPKFSNMKQFNELQKEKKNIIDDINIFITVKDINRSIRIINKKAFDDFTQLLSEGKIGKDEVFTVIDRKRQRFQSTYALMIPKDNRIRQWVLINDVNDNKCLIYKNLLLKIITRDYYENDEYFIYDIHNKERKINPWLIKLKLKNEYELKANRDPALLPLLKDQLLN